jgi:hypothetical protein
LGCVPLGVQVVNKSINVVLKRAEPKNFRNIRHHVVSPFPAQLPE